MQTINIPDQDYPDFVVQILKQLDTYVQHRHKLLDEQNSLVDRVNVLELQQNILPTLRDLVLKQNEQIEVLTGRLDNLDLLVRFLIDSIKKFNNNK